MHTEGRGGAGFWCKVPAAEKLRTPKNAEIQCEWFIGNVLADVSVKVGCSEAIYISFCLKRYSGSGSLRAEWGKGLRPLAPHPYPRHDLPAFAALHCLAFTWCCIGYPGRYSATESRTNGRQP
jgi:hypothetical protein